MVGHGGPTRMHMIPAVCFDVPLQESERVRMWLEGVYARCGVQAFEVEDSRIRCLRRNR